MRKRTLLFSGLLLALCVLLCSFFYPVATSLRVYTFSQKANLLNEIQKPLEILAVAQARLVDPNYSWIVFPQDLSPEIENFIRESAMSTQTSSGENLGSDSNLAYIVSYDGKTYTHNWSEEYDNTPGIIDLTLSAKGEEVVLSESDGISPRAAFTLFNLENKVSVNPALVENSSLNKEFSYKVVLPKGFSIRYYIPSKLTANGGLIARTAASMDTESITFCLAAGALAVLVYVLFWSKEIEAQSLFFRKFIRLKALGAWLLLGAGCILATLGVFSLTQFAASGELTDNLYAIGMRFAVLQWLVPLLCGGLWVVCLLLYAVVFMYIKYIVGFGIARYLREDTLSGYLLMRSENRIYDVVRTPLDSWTWNRLLPFCVIYAVGMLVLMGLFWYFLGWLGGVAVLLLNLFVTILLARRAYTIIHQDYVTTLAAANELAQGNFSEIQPQQVGGFQSLYNSLISVKDGFQTALKDGLASQNMKTQLISNVSHDLKTPVTGIKSYAELISTAQDLGQIKEYSHRLINYTDRLNALITDLFDVARANSGDIQLNLMPINLSELIQQVEGEWADTLAKQDISAVMELPDEAISTLDADKTMRIIDNLMGNISKYAMPGTRIFITLQEIPNEFVLVCKNISKTPLDFEPDEITERFVRGDRSRHEPGSGLGLAIVKSFMEVQGGTFSIEIDGDVFKAILVFPKAKPIPVPDPEVPGDAAGETIIEGSSDPIMAAMMNAQNSASSDAPVPVPADGAGKAVPSGMPAGIPTGTSSLNAAGSVSSGSVLQTNGAPMPLAVHPSPAVDFTGSLTPASGSATHPETPASELAAKQASAGTKQRTPKPVSPDTGMMIPSANIDPAMILDMQPLPGQDKEPEPLLSNPPVTDDHSSSS